MESSKNNNRKTDQIRQTAPPIGQEYAAMDLIHDSLNSGPWSMEFNEKGEMTSCVWSDTFRHMLGYTGKEDFPDTLESWSDLLHEADKSYVMQEYWNTVQDYTGVKTYDVEYRLLTKNSGWRWFHAAGRLSRRDDGSPVAFFGLFIDIDDRKKLEEQLERRTEELQEALDAAQYANRAKTVFLSNMSHDIRTPMNAIINFTNLALESNEAAVQKEYLNNIAISSKHLLDLINKILEFSQIENHKLNTSEELVDMNEFYRKLETIFMLDLKKKHLGYSINVDIQHTYLYMDATHSSQIFTNIISNAIKYTPAGGSINVFCKELPGDRPDTCILETSIKDTGIGMSDEFVSHACETFSREQSSTVSGIQGTGLGLAIVKNLIDLMHGTIHIESRSGQGTSVTIRLPHRIGAPVKAKSTDKSDEIDYSILSGKRVLLADDVDTNIFIATKLLSGKGGCIVESAKDGEECVDMLMKADPGYYDLVLMDIQMPNMNGYNAARLIRASEDKQKASIPILAMTADAFQDDIDKSFEAGMNGHIAKPLNPAKMFRTITETLRKKEAVC